MNISDSERISALLENIGYKPASKADKADLILINTCSVRRSAEDRAFGALKNCQKLKEKNPGLLVAVTGCFASKEPQRLKGKADIIFDITQLFTLPKIIKTHINKIKFNIQEDLYKNYDYLKISPNYSSHYRAYVPVMTGCNNFCSYCVVPYARGREYSRNSKDIVEEIKGLVDKGYKAITLVGQNVNSYLDKSLYGKSTDFPKLLKKVNDIPGDFWIWFITSHPKDMSDELLDTIAGSQKVCNYIHLPVQSGSNAILKSMNREYTREHYLNLIDKIKSKLEYASLSTDTIVGYPNETEKQFNQTVELYKQVKYDMAYIAQYSARPGTAASKLEDNVPCEEKKRRKNILTDILISTAIENNQQLLNKNINVLVEKYKTGTLIGKTMTFKTVTFPGKKNLVGSFAKVKILKAKDWGIEGKII